MKSQFVQPCWSFKVYNYRCFESLHLKTRASFQKRVFLVEVETSTISFSFLFLFSSFLKLQIFSWQVYCPGRFFGVTLLSIFSPCNKAVDLFQTELFLKCHPLNKFLSNGDKSKIKVGDAFFKNKIQGCFSCTFSFFKLSKNFLQKNDKSFFLAISASLNLFTRNWSKLSDVEPISSNWLTYKDDNSQMLCDYNFRLETFLEKVDAELISSTSHTSKDNLIFQSPCDEYHGLIKCGELTFQ